MPHMNKTNQTTISSEEYLKSIIMDRVRTIYFLRKLTGLTGKIIALLLSLTALTFLVSVKSVFYNMPDFFQTYSFYHFFTEAFMQTEFMVQAGVVAVLAIGLFLVKDVLNPIANQLVRERNWQG